MITIHKDVQELLDELNAIGPSAIFGGYLRDRLFGHLPNDVDIVTNIPIEILEKKYSNMEKAKRRITNSGYDVFSFKMHRTERIFIEIVSIKTDILEKAKLADYTLNSLLYNGKKVIDTEGGLTDIQNKLIKEVDVDIITNDLTTRPFLWLKTLRLVSVTGFDLSEETFRVLNENKECVSRISSEILQTEGHKTLNGKNPFKAMQLLARMGLLSDFEVNDNFKEQKYAIQQQQQLCVLAVLAGKKVVDDYVRLYQFQQDLIDKYEKLYGFYFSEERLPSRFRNQIITIQKIVENR